jgi:hypothetical protein
VIDFREKWLADKLKADGIIAQLWGRKTRAWAKGLLDDGIRHIMNKDTIYGHRQHIV